MIWAEMFQDLSEPFLSLWKSTLSPSMLIQNKDFNIKMNFQNLIEITVEST